MGGYVGCVADGASTYFLEEDLPFVVIEKVKSLFDCWSGVVVGWDWSEDHGGE